MARAETHATILSQASQLATYLRATGNTCMHSPDWWMCMGSLCCMLLGTLLLNSTIFPLYYGICLSARDISTGFGVIGSLALYAICMRRPDIFEPRRMFWIALVIVVAAIPLVFLAIVLASPALLVIASSMRTVGAIWFFVMTVLAFAQLTNAMSPAAAWAAACVGWFASALIELAIGACPFVIRIGIYCIAAFAQPALAWKGSRPVVENAIAAGPAASLRVTYPQSFVSPVHAVFVTFILLKMSFGFAITFASSQAAPLSTSLAWIPTLLILAAVIATRSKLDGLYRGTMLCVLAGFLLVNPLIESITGMPALANTMLRAGSDLSRLLILLFAAIVASRNDAGALGIALFANAANSFGSLLGAQLGFAANAVLIANPGAFALLLAVITFAFVAYNMLNPDGFRYDETATSIESVPQVQVVELPVDAVHDTCEHIAAQCNLTPREAQALELLAHGRNAQAIQERMTVSRSTAKTHIRNVYAKLGVHSQQELIDLIEHQ